MGSPASEQGRNPDEQQFKVTFRQGFWIGAYLVTQRQYAELMGTNPSEFNTDFNRPVECVSWDDAGGFCEVLRARLGNELPAEYRCTLPSEAQWEYCCRAGTTAPYLDGSFSAEHIGDFAWYGANSHGMTQPVGLKLPNAWGLYDFQGNVSEWCFDGYTHYPNEEATDWVGENLNIGIVNRGGSWGCTDNRMLRSAHRGYTSRNIRRAWYGFRVAFTR